MWNYQFAGLRILSEMNIPEWSIFACDESPLEPDVRFLLQEPRGISTIEQVVHPDEYHFSIPETAEYWVRCGDEIIITPVPEAGEADIRLFLLGSAWGALCYQRGLLALHASVVQVGEQAMAFCGASGAGKSSLAAGLVARGYPLLGDDLCCFEFIADKAFVYPSTPRLKLWREALENLDLNDEILEKDHFRIDKFQIPIHSSSKSTGNFRFTPLPLGDIYLLTWGDLEIIRLTGLDALRRLIASATYRPHLIDPLGLTGAYWESCFHLAKAASLWELKRPFDWEMMDATLINLINSWQEKFPEL